MTLYSENENYKLYQGNMLDMLEAIDPESIDSIVTDPPYELGFMGKSWDGSGVAFQKESWERCYKVLKSGGYLLAFGGSRTFHRIACAIEDAGFEIRDTIMWLYGSGFPKSMDISKQIDKKGGNDYSKQFAIDLKQARESRNLTMKYCDDKYCNGSTNWSWYEGRLKGVRVPDYQTYLEIIKEFPELEKYRELIKEAEREVIGTKQSGCFNNQEKDKYTIGSSKSLEVDITIPSTDLAKQWQGWGTALKPAYEPIIVARKPFKGSCVDNVIKYGVGGINIDECRVETNDTWHRKEQETNTALGYQRKNKSMYAQKSEGEMNENGRFPANVMLTYDETDFDEVCGGMPNTKSSGGSGKSSINGNFKNVYGDYKGGVIPSHLGGLGDSGSASRYFYCAKASKKDRDEGLDGFEEKRTHELQDRKPNSLGSIMADDGYHKGRNNPANPYAGAGMPKKNTHPTVKPTSLMQYLVRLVTPNGGTVLDPFNGSGSTGKAVMYENAERNKGYKYIGIELTEEYLPIAKARIENISVQPKKELTLFEEVV